MKSSFDVSRDAAIAERAAQAGTAALALIERVHFAKLNRILGRLGASRDECEEVRQRIRVKLFVGRPGSDPAIVAYAGHGSLDAWLKVIATRELLHARRQSGRSRWVQDDSLIDSSLVSDDPELELIKRQYARVFARVFDRAVAALSPRERTVLRHRFADGLSIDEIGAAYGVHRATAARWLTRARTHLLTDIHAEMKRRLRVTSRELESVLRLIASRLEVSLESLAT